jgi:hypothetical protein
MEDNEMADDAARDQSWMHSINSVNNSNKQAQAITTSPEVAALDRSNWITKCAQMVLSSYRRDDFADPAGYAVQLAMVLERYGDDVIQAVTSPTTGIQRTCKFPPTIAEFVEFIDEHVRRSTYTAKYEAQSQKQLKERTELDANDWEITPERRRQIAQEILEWNARRHAEFNTVATKPREWHWKRLNTETMLDAANRTASEE